MTRSVETVHDPDLGTIRQVIDDGKVIATATMSPVESDGSFMCLDESHVFEAGGGLLPTPEQLDQGWPKGPTA